MVEQRRAERRRVRFQLVYDDGGAFNAGTVHDASETGLFLETPLPLPVGSVVKLTPLDRTGRTLFEVPAKVMRIGESGMGLAFIDLGPEGKEQIAKLIRDVEAREADG